MLPVLLLTKLSLTVTLAVGSHGLTKSQAVELLSQVKGIYQEMGIELEIQRFRVIRNPFRKINTLEARSRLFQKWLSYSSRRLPAQGLRVYITPPLMGGSGVWYLGGFASGVCRPDGVVMAVGEPVNGKGEPRLDHSLWGLVHEIGHALGMGHTDSLPATVMHSNAYAYVVPEGLQFSNKSVKEMYQCLN